MKRYRWMIPLVLLSACNESEEPTRVLTIDGTSAESFQSSIDEVKRPMTKEQRAAFEAAMLQFASSGSLKDLAAQRADPEGANRRLRDRLHGMTAAAVVSEAARLRSAYIELNETAAIATLLPLVIAQAHFQATARADENNNGVGEYGSFGELSGAVGVRGGGVLNPPVLSTAFRAVSRSRVSRGGYNFQMFLPAAGGVGTAEARAGGYATGDLDAELAETTWCCYAWPASHGHTGNRTFFVNQAGDVLATDDPSYTGDTGPAASAAFAGSSDTITGRAAVGAAGADGNVWQFVR